MAKSDNRPQKKSQFIADVTALFKVIKSFTYLIDDLSPVARFNIFIDILFIVVYILFVLSTKFILPGQQFAHEGLSLFLASVIGIMVIFGYILYCANLYIKKIDK